MRQTPIGIATPVGINKKTLRGRRQRQTTDLPPLSDQLDEGIFVGVRLPTIRATRWSHATANDRVSALSLPLSPIDLQGGSKAVTLHRRLAIEGDLPPGFLSNLKESPPRIALAPDLGHFLS
jgi:hypothetical protein